MNIKKNWKPKFKAFKLQIFTDQKNILNPQK
jgi:hypothetical protein